MRAGDTPLPFEHGGPLLVVTVRPLGATATSAPVLDVAAALQDLQNVLVPLNWTSHGLRAFIDGVYTGDSGSGDRSHSAAWVLRNGSVVIADAYRVAGSKAHREDNGVPTGVFRDSMVKAMPIGPATSLAVGAALPFLIQATVLGIDGFTFHLSQQQRSRLWGTPTVQGDHLRLAPVLLENVPENAADAVVPMLDSMWNAAGLSRFEP